MQVMESQIKWINNTLMILVEYLNTQYMDGLNGGKELNNYLYIHWLELLLILLKSKEIIKQLEIEHQLYSQLLRITYSLPMTMVIQKYLMMIMLILTINLNQIITQESGPSSTLGTHSIPKRLMLMLDTPTEWIHMTLNQSIISFLISLEFILEVITYILNLK